MKGGEFNEITPAIPYECTDSRELEVHDCATCTDRQLLANFEAGVEWVHDQFGIVVAIERQDNLWCREEVDLFHIRDDDE